MPPSADEGLQGAEPEQPGQRLAVTAEALYLANLMLLPGLAFLVLLWLYFRQTPGTPPLAACHLRQTVSATIWAGALLVATNLLIVATGGYASPGTWAVVILYFTTCHSALMLLGVIGLARAMAGKIYVYPLVGRPCHG
jgi:hypothetical protein